MGNLLIQSNNRKTLIERLTDLTFVLCAIWFAILVGLVLKKPELLKDELNEGFFRSGLNIFATVAMFLALVLFYSHPRRKNINAWEQDCLAISQPTPMSALFMITGVFGFVTFCLSLTELFPGLMALVVDKDTFKYAQTGLGSLFCMFLSCNFISKPLKLCSTGIQMPMGDNYEWEKIESYRWLDAYLSRSGKRDLQFVLKKNGTELSISVPEQHFALFETRFSKYVAKKQ